MNFCKTCTARHGPEDVCVSPAISSGTKRLLIKLIKQWRRVTLYIERLKTYA